MNIDAISLMLARNYLEITKTDELDRKNELHLSGMNLAKQNLKN